MAEDVKIIANVGYADGMLGPGIIYAAKTTGGTYLLAIRTLESGGATVTRYFRRSLVESGYSSGAIKLATTLNLGMFTDAVSPAFVTESTTETFKIIPTVTNLGSLPRLWNFEPEYTLKGEGIVTADIDAVKKASGLKTAEQLAAEAAAGGTTPTTGALGGIIPTDFSTALTNPIKFIQDNVVFVAICLGVFLYIRRKEKKKFFFF